MDYKGDNYYIGEILAGKSIAFSYMVEQHKDKVFNLAFRICGIREEAEEVAQDSFLKAYRSLKEFKMKSSFSTWIYRIVYNTAISQIRSRKEAAISLEEFPADATIFKVISNSEEEAEMEYRRTIIRFALDRIDEEERAIISLYYYDEMSIEEISEVTGITKSNIKVKLYRTRQKMLEIIEKTEKRNSTLYETTARI
jgi:RNA polymerase sigma factor (sigma-70 family)